MKGVRLLGKRVLTQEEMDQISRRDLVRLIGRLQRQGLNAEEIKEWFVHGIPLAMTQVAQRLPKG